jgi:hypothetical protein
VIDEVFDQHRNVFSSFPQRRHINRENVETVEEIAARRGRLDGRLQITVGSSYHADICLDGSSSADALKLVFLQKTQQSDLSLDGKLTDFIEEDRGSFCKFEPAKASLHGMGERTFLMSEQFRANQATRVGCAVDAYNRARRSAATVDGSRAQ